MLGFIIEGVRYFTAAMAHDIADTGSGSMQEKLQAVIDGAFADRATGDDVSVTRGGNVYRIEFKNGMGEQDVPLLEVNDLGLDSIEIWRADRVHFDLGLTFRGIVLKRVGLKSKVPIVVAV